MSNERHLTVESFTDDHALQIINFITVRDGKLAVVEGEDTWRALRAAQRILGAFGSYTDSVKRDEANAEATWICVAWWNERMVLSDPDPKR